MQTEPEEMVKAIIHQYTSGKYQGFNILVFNDEEADIVLRGLAKTGIPYRLGIMVSSRTEEEVAAIQESLEKAYDH